MALNWEQGRLAEGLRCYQRREFFQAHEHWEDVWRLSPEPEKTFLQALIQIAAAFHHFERNNRIGASSLLRASLRKLEHYPDEFGGLDVEGIRLCLRAWLRALDEDVPVEMPFPRIG